LFGGGAVGGYAKFNLDSGNLLLSFLSSFTGDDPEIGSVVGYESEFVWSAAAGVVVGRRSSGLAST